jgi:antitoxin ChpS
MLNTKLRGLGGSVILTIPKPMLELMHLHAGSQVTIEIQDHKLIIESQKKPHYTLAELISQCDLSKSITAEEEQWLNNPPKGKEEI